MTYLPPSDFARPDFPPDPAAAISPDDPPYRAEAVNTLAGRILATQMRLVNAVPPEHGPPVVIYGNGQDTTAQIQAFFDAYGDGQTRPHAIPDLWLAGRHLISSTVTGRFMWYPRIRGVFETDEANSAGGTVQWVGAGKAPMFDFVGCWGADIADLWFRNDNYWQDPGLRPLAPIRFSMAGGAQISARNSVRRCYIGPRIITSSPAGWDLGPLPPLNPATGLAAGYAFDSGILYAGAGNNDLGTVEGCSIAYCRAAWEATNSQNVGHHLIRNSVQGCGAAVKTAANVHIYGLNTNATGLAVQTTGEARVFVRGVELEGLAALATLSSGSSLAISDGYIQYRGDRLGSAAAETVAQQEFLMIDGNFGGDVSFENIQLNPLSYSGDGSDHPIRLRPAAAGACPRRLRLENFFIPTPTTVTIAGLVDMGTTTTAVQDRRIFEGSWTPRGPNAPFGRWRNEWNGTVGPAGTQIVTTNSFTVGSQTLGP